MKNEYIIINRTSIEKRIEELEKDIQYYKANIHYAAMHETAKVKLELENLLSQSTPLIPVLEDVFDSGENYGKTWCEFYNTDSVSKAEAERTENKQDCISNLKLDI